MGHVMAHKPTNLLGVAIVAAMAGALAALLFAPKSGSELRSDIKDKAKRTKDIAEDKMDIAKDKVGTAKDEVKEKMASAPIDADNEVLDEYGRW